MNNLQVFNNSEFGNIRTVEENGQIWFCGKDVAEALGYANSKKAVLDHCKVDGVTICSLIDSMGRNQQAKFINEPNLYRLITHSKLPSAEKFEKWVFEEILPAIRRTGTYGVEQIVTVTESAQKDNVPEIYLEASKIMAACLEGNRPYVLNILRHVVPDIDCSDAEEKVTEIKTTTVVEPQEAKKKCHTEGVPIDINKMLAEMASQNISVEVLAKKANVSCVTVSNWISGKHQPVLQNRTNVCVALGKDKEFLTPKRKRKVKP